MKCVKEVFTWWEEELVVEREETGCGTFRTAPH
jgi:hypothetical protein